MRPKDNEMGSRFSISRYSPVKRVAPILCYGKCDDFIFLIDNFPFISCNIQATTARSCAKYCDIPDITNLLTEKLLKLGYVASRW